MDALIPKKECFSDKPEEVDTNMVIDFSIETLPSWKEKLVGQPSKARSGLDEDDDFDLIDRDIQKSIVNVSQVFISGKIQRTEYEFLPMICFHCGIMGILRNFARKSLQCPAWQRKTTPSEYEKMVVVVMGVEHQWFAPWMLVERKS
ncbi:hypothetical protein Goari_024996, partial [Gossypium aridum]|nr:hypothetical protein [Gossypium aridum]